MRELIFALIFLSLGGMVMLYACCAVCALRKLSMPRPTPAPLQDAPPNGLPQPALTNPQPLRRQPWSRGGAEILLAARRYGQEVLL